MEDNDFSQYCKHMRTSMNMTQSQFAAKLYTSVDTIRAWEQGRQNPSNELMVRDFIQRITLEIN